MKLYHMFTGDLGVNTYFLVNENDRAAVVDPGEDGAAVLAFAEKHGFKINGVLSHARAFRPHGLLQAIAGSRREDIRFRKGCGQALYR